MKPVFAGLVKPYIKPNHPTTIVKALGESWREGEEHLRLGKWGQGGAGAGLGVPGEVADGLLSPPPHSQGQPPPAV